jgi:hypothetical protein
MDTARSEQEEPTANVKGVQHQQKIVESLEKTRPEALSAMPGIIRIKEV